MVDFVGLLVDATTAGIGHISDFVHIYFMSSIVGLLVLLVPTQHNDITR